MLGILQKNQSKLKEGNKYLDVATKQGAVSSIALCDITNENTEFCVFHTQFG